MKILVVFPTELEANVFKPDTYTQHLVSVLISGIGVPATVYSVTKHCLQNRPDLIIHAGICGSFSVNIPIGVVVQVISDCFADIGVIEQGTFKDFFTMGLLNKADFPFSNGKLVLQKHIEQDIQQVNAVTVNTISSTPNQIEVLKNTYNPEIETMEGAAVHYVALQERIPCIHLRAVSNMVGERDKSKWEISKSLNNLHKTIHSLISDFKFEHD